jgi:hypothetical protein
MTQSAKPKTSIREALEILCAPGAVYELRALGGRGTTSGYFDDRDRMAEDARGLSGRVAGVYFTLNPVLPDLLARAVNRVQPYAPQTTNDSQVIKRNWIPLDFDPKRVSGISSTDAEHEAALARAGECRAWLRAQGWPEPLVIDSGNGAHLLYRIDLPNDQASTELVRNCLQALSLLFDDEVVAVDTANFNPARIWKCPGTMTRKGNSTAARPHRMAQIVEAPDVLAVPTPLLQTLADRVPKQEPTSQRNYRGSGEAFDLDQWIVDHGLEVHHSAPWTTGQKWILSQCPWNLDHAD